MNQDRLTRSEAARRDELPNLFAIVSWGCAATKWLAMALNSLPDVLCLHEPHKWFGGPLAEANDAVAHLRTLGLLGTGYALAGDVHGIPRDRLPELRRAFGERFEAAILVREPEPRLISQVSFFEARGFDETLWTGVDYVRTLPGAEQVRHLLDEPEMRFFAHGANMLNAICEEAPLARVVRTEDLTSDAEMLAEFAEFLSGGRRRVEPREVAPFVNRRPVNSHRKPGVALDQEWQLEILRAILREETFTLYEDLGYTMPASWSRQAAVMA